MARHATSEAERPMDDIAPNSVAPRRPVRTGIFIAVLGAALGFGLRAFVIGSSLNATDSDEAIIGLIGVKATQGQFHALFWGQSYGGTIESLVIAPIYAAFGPSVLAGRLLLLVIGGLAAVLTWRIARRLIGERGALLAGALFWTTSSYFVWWSSKINIYYGALCLSLAAWLLVLRLRDDDDPPWWPVAFGLASGAALWSNPQTMYLLVPVGLVYARTLLSRYKSVLLAIPFAVLGAAPWLVYSVRNDWSTLHVPGVDVYLPYHERVLLFFEQLPVVLGFRVPINNEWIVPQSLTLAVGVIAVCALAAAAFRRVAGVGALVVILLGYALLYGFSPQGGQPGATLQPRYLLFAFPALVIALSALLSQIRWRHGVIVSAAVLVFAATLSGIGLRTMDTKRLATPGGVPADTSDLLALLDDTNVRHAYAFYWLSFRTTFESDEEVIVTPAFFHVSRYEPYARAVRESPNPSVIVFDRTDQVQAMENLFASRGIATKTARRGGFAVVVPERGLPREEITKAFQGVGVFA